MSINHSDKSFLGLVIILLSYIFFIYYTLWIILDIIVNNFSQDQSKHILYSIRQSIFHDQYIQISYVSLKYIQNYFAYFSNWTFYSVLIIRLHIAYNLRQKGGSNKQQHIIISRKLELKGQQIETLMIQNIHQHKIIQRTIFYYNNQIKVIQFIRKKNLCHSIKDLFFIIKGLIHLILNQSELVINQLNIIKNKLKLIMIQNTIKIPYITIQTVNKLSFISNKPQQFSNKSIKTHDSSQNVPNKNYLSTNLLSNKKIKSSKYLVTKIQYNFFKQRQLMIDYKKDYYQILKVKQTANLTQIKSSFYKLAKQSHPDTSKGNQQLFKLINQAYNVLSHQERRRQYNLNRVRKDNPNDQNQTKSNNRSNGQKTYEERDNSKDYEQYKQSEQYGERKTQAYYHYNRGQWQQFRSGYKYNVTPQSQYYQNMTNNMSSQFIYQNMERSRARRQSRQENQFLDQMEKYFQYIQKLNQKKAKDRENYQKKMEQLENQLIQKRKLAFRNSFIGRGFTKLQNSVQKITSKFTGLFNKEAKK